MAGRRSAAPLIALALDRAAAPAGPGAGPGAGAGAGAGALHRQIYDQVRELVLDGRLAPGTRLPSTRALARDLGCSRNTAVLAFEQLLSEGYLEGRRGGPVQGERYERRGTTAPGHGKGLLLDRQVVPSIMRKWLFRHNHFSG